jgi:hypothetical protein
MRQATHDQPRHGNELKRVHCFGIIDFKPFHAIKVMPLLLFSGSTGLLILGVYVLKLPERQSVELGVKSG